MTKGKKFTGGDDLTGLEKKVHQVLMQTELRNGYGAYEATFAGTTNSGISFGGNQMDLAAKDKEARKIFKDIIEQATNANKNTIFSNEEFKKVTADSVLSAKGKSPEKVFGDLLPKVNEALSSEYGIKEINEAYVNAVKNKIEHVRKGVKQLDNEENKKILSSDEWIARLVDYHNKFYMGLKKEKEGFNEASILRFLNGDEVTLNNYEYDDNEKIKLTEKGEKKIAKTHKFKIEKKLTVEEFQSYIRKTDEYNKSQYVGAGVDERLRKLEDAISKFEKDDDKVKATGNTINSEATSNNGNIKDNENIKTKDTIKNYKLASTPYTAADFDNNPLVDESLSANYECEYNTNGSLVAFGVKDLNTKFGCGTQLGWWLLIRKDFSAACNYAKQNVGQVGTPFIHASKDKTIVRKEYFLDYALDYYLKHHTFKADALSCLELALQHTSTVDHVMANKASETLPTIFKLLYRINNETPEMIQKLTAKGMKVDIPTCNKALCQTAVSYAVSMKNYNVLKAILDAGADVNKGTWNIVSKTHTSPISMVFTSRDRMNVEDSKIAKLLLERGAKLDIAEVESYYGYRRMSQEDYKFFADSANQQKAAWEEDYKLNVNEFNNEHAEL